MFISEVWARYVAQTNTQVVTFGQCKRQSNICVEAEIPHLESHLLYVVHRVRLSDPTFELSSTKAYTLANSLV